MRGDMIRLPENTKIEIGISKNIVAGQPYKSMSRQSRGGSRLPDKFLPCLEKLGRLHYDGFEVAVPDTAGGKRRFYYTQREFDGRRCKMNRASCACKPGTREVSRRTRLLRHSLTKKYTFTKSETMERNVIAGGRLGETRRLTA